MGHISQVLGGGVLELRGKVKTEVFKVRAPLMEQPWMGPWQGMHTPVGMSVGLTSGDRTRESRRTMLCSWREHLRRWEGEEGPRPSLPAEPGGTQHQGWAEGSTQQGRWTMEHPRSQGVGEVQSKG